jgi:hypothetical protein
MLRPDAERVASLTVNVAPQEFVMKTLRFAVIAMGAGLLMAAPAFAQTTPVQKQPTQDGNSPTTVGPASKAYKQKTQDGNSPTIVGPGSAAYKQKTQDGNGPAMVGPASGAYKQRTQDGNSPAMVGPASGAYKQKTQSLSHGEAPVGVAKQN